MISIEIMGGLGNQLFQIFTTIAYGLRYGHKIVFPYSITLYGVTDRYTYWDTFLSNLKMFTVNSPNNKNINISTFHNLILTQHHYQEIHYIEPFYNVKLFGYFQSYKYFEDKINDIYRLMKIEEKREAVKNENSNLFHKNIYVISMHFRLGDYKYLQESHNILPPSYYFDAMENVLKNSKKRDNKHVEVWYFCENEDNAYVYENYILPMKTKYPIRFVKIDDSIEDWKQMLLLSFADSNIMANSTFSWWGAYFNPNPDVICYPSKWFGDNLRSNYLGHMYPPSWNRIEIP